MKVIREHILDGSGTALVSKTVSLGDSKTYSISVAFDSGPTSSGNMILQVSNAMVTDAQGDPTDWEQLAFIDLTLPENAATESWVFNYTSAGYAHARLMVNQIASADVRADVIIKE